MTLPLRCVCAPLLRGREGEREMERQTEKTEREREGKTETETDRVREREVLNLQNACVGGEGVAASATSAHIAVGLFLPSEH